MYHGTFRLRQDNTQGHDFGHYHEHAEVAGDDGTDGGSHQHIDLQAVALHLRVAMPVNVVETQVYPLGWKRLRELFRKNPGAAELYSMLAENIDGSCGAGVADHVMSVKIAWPFLLKESARSPPF